MEQQTRNDAREYAWKYFALHADQRLRAFNFYLLLVAVVFGGLLTYLKDAQAPAYYACPAGFLLAALSFVFWQIDRRSQELIKHSEGILKALEKDIPATELPEDLRLIVGEEIKTEQIRKERGIPGWNPLSWIRGHFGYYSCFKAAFLIFGGLGIVIGVGVLVTPAFIPPVASAPLKPPSIEKQSTNASRE